MHFIANLSVFPNEPAVYVLDLKVFLYFLSEFMSLC